jgi:hypothetical protein
MALNTRGSVDPRWLTNNRSVSRALNLATVEIFKTGVGGNTYDAATNTWTSTTEAVYSGRARIQQVNAVSETSDNYNPTFVKTVRVQIAYNTNEASGAVGAMPDIRPGQKMRVTASPYNESLTKFIYVVTDVLNSSNSWERTILCRVDTELDPTEV